MSEELKMGFVGNPNCGKTTLFNAYTGANLKVANWPGVTVEKKEGAMKHHNHLFKLVDLPGTYSLNSYTLEETVTRQYIMSDDVDVIIDVADASSLERNLFLTLQLIELGKPVVLALNMMDIVKERGMEIDLHRLPEMLGIPVIPVSARKKTGLDILIHAASHHKSLPRQGAPIHHHMSHTHHQHEHHQEYAMVYSDELEDKIDLLITLLKEKYPEQRNYRWLALKHLAWDQDVREHFPLDLPDVLDVSYEKQIINQKYEFIEEIMEEVMVRRSEKAESTDKIDAVLTHKIFGLPIFLCIMAMVFFLTFIVGDWLKSYFELFLTWFSTIVGNGLEFVHASAWVHSLIVDGIIAGVGGILTFLPNIFILFLALAFLEDSGYMARVAYVMDTIMGRIGLSGRAFIPMLLGFGCTVPAIMSSRTLETRRDRLKTILVTPFMSCSARLPIYVLFSEMFFPKHAMLTAFSLYLLGMLMAIIVAFMMSRFEKNPNVGMLIIELPEYKSPNARTIIIYVWEKVKDYLTKAGTTIFIASIVMWMLMNLGPSGYVASMQDSFGAIAGKVIEPLFVPCGLGNWQIVVALISGIAAKEVVVSSCSVLFGIGNVNSKLGMSQMTTALAAMGFGALNAYALMVFCLLYVPCAATIATIKKETQSTKMTVFMVFFQLGIAYIMATIIYQIGRLFI